MSSMNPDPTLNEQSGHPGGRLPESAPPPEPVSNPSAEEVKRLVRELQIHQLELAVQNKELRKLREELESSHRKYADLYDCAPVGYFTFAHEGVIVDLNLTGAAMLGVARDQLLNHPFTEYIVDAADREQFREHIAATLNKAARGECRIRLRRSDGSVFVALLQSISTDYVEENTIHIRTAISDITDHERAEQALRESETKYRIVADNTYAWEFWIDPDGRFLYVSPSCKRITGYDAEEFLLDPSLFTRIIYPEDSLQVSDHLQIGAHDAQPEEAEFRIIRADGSIRWISHECQPVFDKHGRFRGRRGSNREITKRKQIETALSRAEAKYHGLFDAITGGVLMHDRNGMIIEANPAACEILGLPLDQIRGRTDRDPCWHAIHEDGSPFQAGEHPSMRALQTGRPIRDVVMGVFHAPSSRYRWILINAEPILDHVTNEVGAVVVTFLDITTRKTAEDALRETQARFQAVLENSLDAAYRRDLQNDRYDYMSPVIEQITGFTAEEYGSMGVSGLLDRIHPEDVSAIKRILDESQSGVRREGLFDYRFKCKSGEYRWVSKNFRIVNDVGGRPKYRIGSLRDITGQKRAEETINKSGELLEKTFLSLDTALFILTDGDSPVITECNPAAMKMFGYEKEDMVGQSVHLLHLDNASYSEFREATLAVINRQGFLSSFEFLMRRQNGDRFSTEHSIFPLTDNNGNRIGWICAIKDISERKAVERTTGRYLKNLEFLSTAAVEFLRTISSDRFFSFAAEKLYALADNTIVIVTEYSPEKECVTVRAASGNRADMEALSTILGKNPVGLSFKIVPEIFESLNPGTLVKVDGGLYAVSFNEFSQELCQRIERELQLGDLYLMPFAIGNDFLGVTAIFSHERKLPDNHRMIASFIHLATLSFQRISAENSALQARDQLEIRVRERTHELDQRVKELNCLYTIRNTLEKQHVSLEEKLQVVVQVICQGLQYPEIACARIVFDQGTYETENFRDTEWNLTITIPVRGGGAGSIVVCYLEQRPFIDAGPFLREERELIDAIAWHCGEMIDRTKSEAQIRQSQRRLFNTLESITDAFFTLDRDWRFTYVNHAAERLLRNNRELMIGKSIWELSPQMVDTVFDREYRRAVRQHTPVSFEAFSPNLGSWVEVRAYPVREGLTVYLQDITERKLTQEKLTLFRDLINQSSDSIFLVDPETGNFLEANDGASEALLYGRQELLSMNVKDISLQQSDQRRWEHHIRELREKGYVLLEDTFIRKNGTTFSAEVNVKYLTHENRNYLVAVARDITDRKQAEMERARLAAAVEATAEAVVITDTRGIIQYVNPAFEQITGYSRAEAVGQSLHLLDSGKHDHEFYQGIRDTLMQSGVWRGRMIQKKKDATLYEEDCVYSPVWDDKGRIIYHVSIKRDITERLRLESIAEAVNTMENIGYIFSGVRHEIGNPINSVNMILGILKAKLDGLSKDAIREYLDRTVTQVSRVEYLLKTLKSFNMYEQLDIRNLHIPSFLEKFLSLVKEDFAKYSIKIEIQVSPEAEWVSADARALQQVLLNVLTNAAAALTGRQNQRISIEVWKANDMVLIRVTDNGCGITPEQLRNVFKPFYTTKAEGTGLGLVIAKKMLTKMNGVIDLTSKLDAGTIVNIFLPEGKKSEPS